MTALAVEQSKEWMMGRRYLDMGELEDQPRQERVAEEVTFTGRRWVGIRFGGKYRNVGT